MSSDPTLYLYLAGVLITYVQVGRWVRRDSEEGDNAFMIGATFLVYGTLLAVFWPLTAVVFGIGKALSYRKA